MSKMNPQITQITESDSDGLIAVKLVHKSCRDMEYATFHHLR